VKEMSPMIISLQSTDCYINALSAVLCINARKLSSANNSLGTSHLVYRSRVPVQVPGTDPIVPTTGSPDTRQVRTTTTTVGNGHPEACGYPGTCTIRYGSF
jgi:hypothetical protein